MSKSLIAFDTDRVKDYVFATSKLKEMRGASALLDYLNRKKMVELVGGDRIYANGGGGLFIADTEQADSVIQAVQRVYRQETHTASITGVAVKLPEPVDGDIEEQLKLIRYRLRAEKDSQSAPALLLTHPLLHFCNSCGTQYAETYDDDDLLCASCQTKRQMDDRIKQDIRAWVSGKYPPDENRLWGRLIRDLKGQGYPVSGRERPKDFEELSKLSSPTGYMALIYADGDNMGREIEQITDRDKLQQFANAVDNSLYQAVTQAIHEHLQPQPDAQTWPFDVLLLGGDDLVMVTRAQSGIEVALNVVERFSELTEKSWGKRLNLSASVAIAHTNYPIGLLLQLAESGLKFAKREGARRRMEGESLNDGLINFLVVSSANHGVGVTQFAQPNP